MLGSMEEEWALINYFVWDTCFLLTVSLDVKVDKGWSKLVNWIMIRKCF